MGPVATSTFSQWRSPPPAPTPGLESIDLPNNAASPRPGHKVDLLHPSFLPPCEQSKDGGEMHAHAFDLLSLASNGQGKEAIASSVPVASYLSSTRPPNQAPNGGSTAPAPPKSRRMSSSTTGVLGRGKLGLTGDPSLGKDMRPTLSTSVSNSSPITGGRRLSNAANGSPQLFDFAKTDRRPSATRSTSRGGVAASLPSRGMSGPIPRVNPAPPIHADDMELDMEFGDDDEELDDGGSGGRSGSAELDMDMDTEMKPEWEKLALGTGSGGIKGRRKGMVFKCENCAKEYRHPSCLVKHRWEHSPHWREPTQISMSKHQQVQMLEAAAILAHMDPDKNQGRSLPTDKSLWPAMLSSPQDSNAQLQRSVKSSPRDLPNVRSPPSSTAPPLTPSSLREVSNFRQPRKSSPGSDSTSSMGASESFTGTSPNPNSLGLDGTRPVGISVDRRSSVSSVPGPTTPGSLPDMAALHFHTGNTPTGTSPLPNRGALPLSLGTRAAMIGGGMFGSRSASFKVPDSSVRGGVPEDDEEESFRTKKGSSEERDDQFEIGTMEL